MADPTVYDGTISSITDVTNVRIDISDAIDFLSPFDVPLLQRVGTSSLRTPCTQIKHEWMEDELTPQSTTLASAYTAGSGSITVASGAGKYFYVDDILMIGTNVLRVVSISTDVLTVIGGLGDTTDADASSGDTVRRIAHAAQEGAVARVDSRKTAVVRPYNYTQIFKSWVTLTGTMEVIRRYGYASERAYQEAKEVKKMAINMESALIYNPRTYSASPRHSTAGGLAHFIRDAGISGSWPTVVDNGGAEFTESVMNDMLQAIWEKGGQPSLIVVNGYNKRKMSEWSTPRIRSDVGETMGGGIIARYTSDFGEVDIMLDRNLVASDVLFLTPEDIGFGPLTGRQLTTRMLPSLGDYTQSEMMGEYTIEVHRPSMAHGWLYNTATSG